MRKGYAMADLEALIRSLDRATIHNIICNMIATDMMILKSKRMPCDARELCMSSNSPLKEFDELYWLIFQLYEKEIFEEYNRFYSV